MSELSLFDGVAVIAAQMPEKVFTEPDDDWHPIAFLETANGRATFPLAQFMEDDIAKDILAEVVLPTVIREMKATSLVTIFSIWQSETSAQLHRYDSENFVPPSQCDDRTEHVMVTEYSPEGITRTAFAQITRYEDKPPTLSDWEQMDEALGHTGRFVEPLVKALKETNG